MKQTNAMTQTSSVYSAPLVQHIIYVGAQLENLVSNELLALNHTQIKNQEGTQLQAPYLEYLCIDDLVETTAQGLSISEDSLRRLNRADCVVLELNYRTLYSANIGFIAQKLPCILCLAGSEWEHLIEPEMSNQLTTQKSETIYKHGLIESQSCKSNRERLLEHLSFDLSEKFSPSKFWGDISMLVAFLEICLDVITTKDISEISKPVLENYLSNWKIRKLSKKIATACTFMTIDEAKNIFIKAVAAINIKSS